MSDSFDVQKWRFNLMLEALEKETQEQLDELLPKIKKKKKVSYTDYGVLYKIRMYGADGKELYILGDDDDVFKYNRLDADNVRYIAQQLKIPVTDDFAGRSYNFDYYQSLIPSFKDKGIELSHDDVMDTS